MLPSENKIFFATNNFNKIQEAQGILSNFGIIIEKIDVKS